MTFVSCIFLKLVAELSTSHSKTNQALIANGTKKSSDVLINAGVVLTKKPKFLSQLVGRGNRRIEVQRPLPEGITVCNSHHKRSSEVDTYERISMLFLPHINYLPDLFIFQIHMSHWVTNIWGNKVGNTDYEPPPMITSSYNPPKCHPRKSPYHSQGQ